jgi:hypothetical protein
MKVTLNLLQLLLDCLPFWLCYDMYVLRHHHLTVMLCLSPFASALPVIWKSFTVIDAMRYVKTPKYYSTPNSTLVRFCVSVCNFECHHEGRHT